MTVQARATATRQRLLDAAAAEFSRHGYDATGVAEICTAAGVTKGAFYHHFPSKQQLFLDLLNAWLLQLDERVQSAMPSGQDVATRLLSMGRAAQGALGDARGQVPMFLEFWTRSARDPSTWRATIEPYRRYRAWFAALVAEGVADGSLRAVDPKAAARVIVAVSVGLLLQGLLDPDGADWRRAADESVAILLDGLRRRR